MRPRLKRMICNTVPTPIRPAIAGVFRSCKNKNCYTNEEKGWRAVRSIEATGTDTHPDFPLRPYKCDVCFGWHIGHDFQHPKDGK